MNEVPVYSLAGLMLKMRRGNKVVDVCTASAAITWRHYATTSAPMRDRKRRTVTDFKPEALRIAVGGERVWAVAAGSGSHVSHQRAV